MEKTDVGSRVPQTNGLPERRVRKVKEGGSAGTVQSGLKAKRWWQFAVRHKFFSDSIVVVDGDSSYNRSHKKGHFFGYRLNVRITR